MPRATQHLRSNAVAYAALFVALGGTSYAAVNLPRNSVGRAQLRDNSVGTKEVTNRSLRRADFAAGQLPAGPAGPAGQSGPTGPPGPAGASATSLWAVVRADGTLVRSSGVQSVGRTNGGTYAVIFTRDVAGCADLVNLGGYTIGGEVALPSAGEAAAGVAGNGTPVSTQTVNVFTRDSAGNLADRGFHLAVFC